MQVIESGKEDVAGWAEKAEFNEAGQLVLTVVRPPFMRQEFTIPVDCPCSDGERTIQYEELPGLCGWAGHLEVSPVVWLKMLGPEKLQPNAVVAVALRPFTFPGVPAAWGS